MIALRRAVLLAAIGALSLTACGASTPGDGSGASADAAATVVADAADGSTTLPTTTTPSTTVATPPVTRVPTTSPTTSPDVTTTISDATTTMPSTTTTVPATVERSGAGVGPTDTVGDPLGIRIASLGVDSPIVATGLHDDGTVAVPPSADVAGWFDQGPRPGQRGPAVVMAHVDSASTGPGVFYRLRDIQVGAIVTIDTADGPIDFVTERIEQHPKIEFPTDDVYGPVPRRELRLVTCGGEFDRSVRSYYDNIIVYLVRSTP